MNNHQQSIYFTELTLIFQHFPVLFDLLALSQGPWLTQQQPNGAFVATTRTTISFPGAAHRAGAAHRREAKLGLFTS